ncbi:hypothetical protein [Ciceribacter selenitireducens]
MTERDDWRRMSEMQDMEDREKLMKRLEAGEEINLEEALFLADVRNNSQVFRLGDFLARGRIGEPFGELVEIPQDAWSHLGLVRNTLPFTVKSPTGVQIFSLLFRLPTATDPAPYPATGGEPAATPAASAIACEDPEEVIRRIAAADRPHGKKWTFEEYRDELGKDGLTMSADNERIIDVSISDGRIVRLGGGKTRLVNLLMFAWASDPANAAWGGESKRGYVRRVHSWLRDHHGNLTTARVLSDDNGSLDRTIAVLRDGGIALGGTARSQSVVR